MRLNIGGAIESVSDRQILYIASVGWFLLIDLMVQSESVNPLSVGFILELGLQCIVIRGSFFGNQYIDE